ncbi:MAG: class I tRNA ligase family protein, partial [Gammaproteobacteria bacterium]|nr:class I tRNA ligase family protein [Gammaproteobacteria bacterium]
PGWHIECSAMSTHCLGSHFDIHGGGLDLQFPHHENEIAQSCAATGDSFVNVWMHNGFVRVDDEKMSKSLGNFFTIREVMEKYTPEVIRYFILTSHYRSPLNYSDKHLDNARAALTTLYNALRDIDVVPMYLDNEYAERFDSAMADDFNTPEALTILFELAKALNKSKEKDLSEAKKFAAQLKHLGLLLGLLQDDPEQFLRDRTGQSGSGLSDDEVDSLIQQREQARLDKDWSEADRIRDLLSEQGIILEDGAGKTGWRRG